MDSNLKVHKKKGEKASKVKTQAEGNSIIEGSISNFSSESQDPANVISFGGTLENTVDKEQIDQIKQFVRDSRTYSGPMESKKKYWI